MKSLKKWIRDIFGFSGNEINGFLILIPLMLVLVVSQPLYTKWRASGNTLPGEDSIRLDSLVSLWGLRRDSMVTNVENHALFFFDPNTAGTDDLRRLGLTDRSATHIAAYRRKGGVFKVKSDLLRISGLDSTLYNRLYAYIRLPTRRTPAYRTNRAHSGRKSSSWRQQEVKDKFDINTADTLQLKSVYGIGSRLAARIVKFREGLGGFVQPEQLYEVYGLDSMTVNRLLNTSFIKADFVPEKININSADEKRLSAHPYIRYKMARLLVSYRFQHGDFIDVTDIKKLSAIEAQELERLLPYIKVKE